MLQMVDWAVLASLLSSTDVSGNSLGYVGAVLAVSRDFLFTLIFGDSAPSLLASLR